MEASRRPPSTENVGPLLRTIATVAALLLLVSCERSSAPERVERSEPAGGTAIERTETTAPDAPAQRRLITQLDDEEPGSLYSRGTVVDVVRVIDGDTLQVSPPVDGRGTVQLIGVDAPETAGPDGRQPLGRAAYLFTSVAMATSGVALELDVRKTDSGGRLLAYAWVSGDQMVNERLLREGYALTSPSQPNTRYAARFQKAQAEARKANKGIWRLEGDELCGLADAGNDLSANCAQGREG